MLVDPVHVIGVSEPVAVVERAVTVRKHDPVKHVLLCNGEHVGDRSDLLAVGAVDGRTRLEHLV